MKEYKYNLKLCLVNFSTLSISISDNGLGADITYSNNGSCSVGLGTDKDDTFSDDDLNHSNRSRTKVRLSS